MRLNKKFLKKFKAVREDSSKKIAVHCETEKEAEAFCEWMHSMGLRWSSGDSYKDLTYWGCCSELAYTGRGTKSDVESLVTNGWEVVKFSEIKPKRAKLNKEFLKRFTKDMVAVQCSTKKEAEDFCYWLNEMGLTWSTGDSYSGKTNWDLYKDKTIYSSDGMYGTWDGSYRSEGYKVIKFSELVKETQKKDFRDAVVGDKVWNVRFGWGEIIRVCHDQNYPIHASFIDRDDYKDERTFTFDGLYMKSDNLPSIFWEDKY